MVPATASPAPLLVGFLAEMLSYGFMQRALVAGLCVGVVAPLVGSFLVHRELAMIGETLAHTAFAGVAAGLLLGSALEVSVSPALTALVVAVLAALLVQVLAERTGVYGDVSMMIVLAGGFAAGTVLLGLADGGIAVGVESYIFGNLATMRRGDVEVLVASSVLVATTVLAFYRQLAFVTFDETGARVAGVDATRINRLLVVLTALVVVGAMQMMGVILVAAMLVVPVAAGTQVAGSFRGSVLASIGAGLLAVLVGIPISYAYGVASGGTVVLVAIGLYLVAALARSAGLPRSI